MGGAGLTAEAAVLLGFSKGNLAMGGYSLAAINAAHASLRAGGRTVVEAGACGHFTTAQLAQHGYTVEEIDGALAGLRAGA